MHAAMHQTHARTDDPHARHTDQRMEGKLEAMLETHAEEWGGLTLEQMRSQLKRWWFMDEKGFVQDLGSSRLSV